MLQGEHSAILLTFIKLPFVMKIFDLSIFEWPFYTDLTVIIVLVDQQDSHMKITTLITGAQWLSGRVLDSRPRGHGFEPHWRHCIVFLSKNINPSLVLVQPRKTRPFITERLLMGRKESNQTNNCN